MSFVPGFAPDAESEWRALDVELQELVLDELDRLAVTPIPGSPPVIFRDVVRDAGGVRHYVFLRLVVDRAAEKITVIGVVHHSRSLGP